MDKNTQGVQYTRAGDEYFAKRGLQKYAGVWSLWALGVGAVISGHYSGWILGLTSGGWAGAFAAMPFAVWLFLSIEQLPLAAEESVDPQRDIPQRRNRCGDLVCCRNPVLRIRRPTSIDLVAGKRICSTK